MLVALWVCEPNWQRRLGWFALFLIGMVSTATVVAWALQGHPGSVGAFDLIWTGKAVRSVWAGFTWAKVGYMWDGMVGYLLGAGVAAIPGIPGWDIWRWVATVWMLAVAFFALPFLWRHWDDPRRVPCRRSSASPSWRARCSTSTPSRRTRRCRSTSWPG